MIADWHFYKFQIAFLFDYLLTSDPCKKYSVFNDLTAIISVEIPQGDNCSGGPPIDCYLKFKPEFKIM